MLFEDPTRPDDFTKEVELVLEGSPNSIVEPEALPFQLDEVARRTGLAHTGFVDVASELIQSELEMDAAQVRALYATMAVILRRPPEEQARALDALEARCTRSSTVR